jgi:hypothetical protein
MAIGAEPSTHSSSGQYALACVFQDQGIELLAAILQAKAA